MSILIAEDKNGKEQEEMKIENEDKRKLIDEIGGILKGKVDDEIIRTILKKAEELSYKPSEDDKADNKKAKNEEKENKKEEVKNSMDEVRKIAYNGGEVEEKPLYISIEKRYELGNKY